MANPLEQAHTWGTDSTYPANEVDKRKQEVSKIIRALKEIRIGEEGNRYYPIRFLREAIDAYTYVFSNGAIYYASLALELALVQRLAEIGSLKKWRDKEREEVNKGKKKREQDYPSFENLIKWAFQEKLLDRKTNEEAHGVLNLRNAYIHYYNVMWHQIDIDNRTRRSMKAMLPKVQEEIHQKFGPSVREEILKFFNSLTDSVLSDRTLADRQIPTADIRPNKKALKYIEKRERSFANLLSDYMKRRDSEVVRLEMGGVETKDALDCLSWSADIFVQLGFISKVK